MFSFLKNIFGKKREKEDTSKTNHVRAIRLQVNDKVVLHKDEDIPKLWRGKIFSVSETTFSVDIPDLMGEFPFPFREGNPVRISVPFEEKTAHFTVNLEKIAWKAKPPILIFTYPTKVEWKETKERKYVRIKADVPAKVKLDTPLENSWEMVRIVDFSIAGLSFVAKVPYQKGKTVLIKIMSMQYPLNIKGTIVRCTKLEERADKGKHNYNVGVKFVQLTQMDKEMLSGFAYQLSRKASNK